MRLLVTGGGTGGHIYPALAIARRALDRGVADAVLFVGASGGMEERLVAAAGLPLKTLPTSGLVRKRPVEVVRGLWVLAGAVRAAIATIREFRPDVVVGTGGYAAGPVGLAAGWCRCPLVVQEQNAIPGVTNRALARFAAAVAVPFPDSRRHFPGRARLQVTGNPVRPEVGALSREEGRRRLGLPSGPVVLVVAGSRGSAVFTRLFAELLPRWRGGTLVFVSGAAHHAAAERALADAPAGVRLLPYLEDMPAGLAAADLVVCRAGAMTLAELAVAGRPALLIPSPYVTHHHQEANARVFARAGAALVLPEAGLDGARLGAAIADLLAEPVRLRRMAEAARGLARPRALDDIVALAEAAGRRRAHGRRAAPPA